MFPEELPARLIRMFSFHGETVLDPFLGSGTTSLAARNLGRSSIGYEINPDNIPVIRTKLNTAQADLEGSRYEFRDRPRDDERIGANRATVPFVFKDPHAIDKKVDPRALTFGSRVSNDTGDREEYHTVKAVIDACTVRLSNDVTVRLIGVRTRPDTSAQAVQWLEETIRGQRVYLRFDDRKFDEQGHMLVYLHLKNKTFLNAHLIKRGLAEVDPSAAFRMKDRFERYAQEVTA